MTVEWYSVHFQRRRRQTKQNLQILFVCNGENIKWRPYSNFESKIVLVIILSETFQRNVHSIVVRTHRFIQLETCEVVFYFTQISAAIIRYTKLIIAFFITCAIQIPTIWTAKHLGSQTIKEKIIKWFTLSTINLSNVKNTFGTK